MTDAVQALDEIERQLTEALAMVRRNKPDLLERHIYSARSSASTIRARAALNQETGQ